MLFWNHPCRVRSRAQFVSLSIFKPFIVIVVWSLSTSDSLQPHGLQHTRLPCPPLSLRVCSNSCSLSQWCYLTSHPLLPSSTFTFNIYEFLICFRELSVSETQGLKSPTVTTDVAIYLCSSSFAIRDYVLIYIFRVAICSFLSCHWIFVPFIRLHTR